jgi:hypothetical protein
MKRYTISRDFLENIRQAGGTGNTRNMLTPRCAALA